MSDVAHLKRTLDRIPRGGLAEAFYRALFAAHPDLRTLFSTDPGAMEQKFEVTLRSIVESLDRPADMAVPLRTLGQRHDSYGVHPDHYRFAGEALREALRECLGETWTPDLERAWNDAYSRIVEQMTGKPTG
jgi:hemoglobin-like flavoprotein